MISNAMEDNTVYEGLENIWVNYEDFKNKFEERIALLAMLIKHQVNLPKNNKIYDGLEDIWLDYEDFKNKFEGTIASIAIKNYGGV